MTDGGTNTLALRGLEEPAHASRGLEEPFFQLCCCVSFWFWVEIVFGVTYVLSVQYSCAVVSVFLCGRKANLVQIFLLNLNFLLVFLALYGSTTIVSRLFLKKYQEFCLIS